MPAVPPDAAEVEVCEAMVEEEGGGVGGDVGALKGGEGEDVAAQRGTRVAFVSGAKGCGRAFHLANTAMAPRPQYHRSNHR